MRRKASRIREAAGATLQQPAKSVDVVAACDGHAMDRDCPAALAVAGGDGGVHSPRCFNTSNRGNSTSSLSSPAREMKTSLSRAAWNLAARVALPIASSRAHFDHSEFGWRQISSGPEHQRSQTQAAPCRTALASSDRRTQLS